MHLHCSTLTYTESPSALCSLALPHTFSPESDQFERLLIKRYQSAPLRLTFREKGHPVIGRLFFSGYEHWKGHLAQLRFGHRFRWPGTAGDNVLDNLTKRRFTYTAAPGDLNLQNNPDQQLGATPPNQVFKMEPGTADDDNVHDNAIVPPFTRSPVRPLE